MVRIIAHLDLDAFFASVEERDKPYLKGAPIVVGADPQGGMGRGVVSTASYTARAYGIRSATPIKKAWQLSEAARQKGLPGCIFITPEHYTYGKASDEVFAIVRTYVPQIEQVSVDEAYLDMSAAGSFARAARSAQEMRQKIKDVLGLTASIGVGPNKLIAKLATEAAKPDGLKVVREGSVDALLLPLPLSALPGIGTQTMKRFERAGYRTVRDARRMDWKDMRRLFGTHGFSMYERLRGIDERPVESESAPALSIGKHHTFDADIDDLGTAVTCLNTQAASIVRSMRKDGFEGFRTVVLTVRFSDFETMTRSLTVATPLATVRDLELKALKMIMPFFERKENPHRKRVRLIGLRIEKLQ